MRIYATCQSCKKTEEWVFSSSKNHSCTCGNSRIPQATDKFLTEKLLNQCPICGCPHIYRQKDFNRRLGVLLIIIGVILAYWTYGISLVVVTLVDWCLIRYVKELGVCYKCQAQFRESPTIQSLETFNLSLHDYYKNLTIGVSGSEDLRH